MKVSLKWLSDYVDVPSDIKEFCDRLRPPPAQASRALRARFRL